MPKYRTLDQHILYRGEMIPNDTEVTVSAKDAPTWDKLVEQRVAIKVPKAAKKEEPQDTSED